MEILIIGAGVSGLTTGLTLLRAGHAVRIWARDVPPNTTSNVAAAVWYPYKAYPPERVTAWGAETYRTFLRLAEDSSTGVALSELFDMKREPAGDPEWAGAVGGYRHARPDELPPGFADGYVFAVPVIDTGVYLDYLMRLFQETGGVIERREVSDLAAGFERWPVVVNCAGLGAGGLVGDHDVHPSRGQVVRVRHNGYRRVLLDERPESEGCVTYIVPRLHDIVLGGTDDEGNGDTTPDPAVTRDILRRATALEPSFAGLTEADVLSVAVGLRPVRSKVRLESERPTTGRALIHNYGHGGAGVTLSWGCASEVARLVAEAVA